jgi:hypothetical protein
MDLQNSSHSALTEWLFGAVQGCEELKAKCTSLQDRKTQNLVIVCADSEVVNRLPLPLLERVAIKAIQFDAPFVEVWTLAEWTSESPDRRPEYVYSAQAALLLVRQVGLLRVPSAAVSIPGIGQNGSIAIARMHDHVGLYCANIEQHCAAKANDWLGKDMSRYHIPSELERLVRSLEQHGRIASFTYRALDFELREKELTVNAWLAEYQGDLCRVVEVLHSALV